MKSTRLHLAKGIKLIQRLLKEQASFFASLVREGFKRAKALVQEGFKRLLRKLVQDARWCELVQRVQDELRSGSRRAKALV